MAGLEPGDLWLAGSGSAAAPQEFWNRSMFANIPTWTTERVELLKQHFEAGLSCREIAAQIGVSRNAVIGKLTRLGLTRGAANVEQHLQATTRERSPKSVPRAQYRMLQVVYQNGQPAIDAPITSERPCSLLEL